MQTAATGMRHAQRYLQSHTTICLTERRSQLRWSRMNKLLRRQEGIKRAKKLIKANPLWRQSFNILIKTRTPCSCPMCGHRREHLGKTYQEQKADLELQE